MARPGGRAGVFSAWSGTVSRFGLAQSMGAMKARATFLVACVVSGLVACTTGDQPRRNYGHISPSYRRCQTHLGTECSAYGFTALRPDALNSPPTQPVSPPSTPKQRCTWQWY